MGDSITDFMMEAKEGPICRPVSVGVTESMEEKVEWLKKVKRVDVNKFLRRQLQFLIERAESGEFDRQNPA